jgi:hypothetical protein
MLATCAILHADWSSYPLWEKEALYLVETGSVVTAIAIGIALIATV